MALAFRDRILGFVAGSKRKIRTQWKSFLLFFFIGMLIGSFFRTDAYQTIKQAVLRVFDEAKVSHVEERPG